MYNGLCNSITGAWRGHEELSETGKCKHTKNKLMSDLIPAFADKYNKDTQEGLELLLLFIMAKNIHMQYQKMLKER